MDLTSLGEFLLDMFPAETGRRLADVSAFRPVPGGAPANVAVAAARLGRSSAFIGQLGDDAFGHHLSGVLQREGVSTQGVRFDPAAHTTLAFIALPTPTAAEFLFYSGAHNMLRADELDCALLADTRALHIGSISLIAEPARSATLTAVQLARASGALISFDVNYRPTLWPAESTARETITAVLPQADLLKVNETELRLLTGTDDLAAGTTTLLAQGPRACVVTLGADGSYFRTATASGLVPGFSVKVVDAVGCGDAFLAALLSQLLLKGDPRAALDADLTPLLRYANAAGALTATRQGVIPALPTSAEVESFLNSHSS